MIFHRLGRLLASVLCFAVLLLSIGVRQAAAQQQQPQQQPPKPPNPFETVPQGPVEPKPAPAPPPAQPAQQPATPGAGQEPARAARPGQPPPDNVIEAIEFRGARRVRQDTLH